MYDKCYFCLDQLPKLKKESTASFSVNFGGAGVQKSRPTLLYSEFSNIQNMKIAKIYFVVFCSSYTHSLLRVDSL